MKQLLSPKQVAASVGASESSLKRWCDQGLIPIEKTPGGHRRIRLRDAIQFIRKRGGEVVEPAQLGLPGDVSPSTANLSSSIERLTAHLDGGDAESARRMVFSCYLGGVSLGMLCDELLAPAMHELGREWQCGRLDIYQERRACEIVGHLLYELGEVAPRPREDAPVAIGGSPEGDHYRLATIMVALSLTEAGWNATSLGSSLPFDTLVAAAKEQEPSIFWLSVSQCDDAKKLADDITGLAASLPQATHLVLGGQAAPQDIAVDLERVTHCDNLQQMREYAASIAG